MIVGPDFGDPSDLGPNVRAHALARALPGARLVVSSALMAGGVGDPEVVIAPPWADLDALKGSRVRLVVDLAHARPFAAQTLAGGRLRASLATDRLTGALRSADHLITSTESQRDLWIGAMVSERLLRQEGYKDDPTLRSLIETVPTPPWNVATRTVGAAGAHAILWNGPRHPWLDWATAEAAVAQVPGAVLVTMDSDRWLTEHERATLVANAACVVRLHRGDLAAKYSASQRLSDCIAWGTPMVATHGDETARNVATLGLGEVVPPGDPAAVATAIARVIRERERHVAALTRARERWVQGVEALERIIQGRRQPIPLPSKLARRLGERARGLGRRIG